MTSQRNGGAGLQVATPWPLGFMVICLAALCVYAIRQVDADLYGYLAYGRLFAERGGPTAVDPFAYTSGGTPWIAFEHAAQTLLWMAYDTFGPIGLIGLKCLAGGTAVFFLWRAVRTSHASPIVWAPVFLFCTSMLSRYFLFRPQLFTFACFAYYVAVLFRYLIHGRGALWTLPIIMLLWANLHGGFLAGLGAIGLAIVIRAIQVRRARLQSRRSEDAGLESGASYDPGLYVGRDFSRAGSAGLKSGPTFLLLILSACFVATFVNPWGVRLWQYVLTELSHDTNRRYISEWRPATAGVDPWSGITLTVLTAVVVGAGFVAERRRSKVAGLRPWHWVATCVPLIVMAYVSVRHVPLAATWTAPVIALLLTTDDAPAVATLARYFAIGLASLALVPIMVTVEYVAADLRPVIRTGGAVLGPTNPCQAVRFIRDNKLQGNVYTPLWWGSYLTWETYPAIRVSMDGRNISAFPPGMVSENLHFYSPAARRDDLETPLRYDTDFLLVPSDAIILESVRSDRRWRQIYRDADAFLFVRADEAHALIEAARLRPPQETCRDAME